MKEAVVVIARRGSRFLGVSRRDDPDAFGLPGGKVDPGEDAETAARRELFEETGLRAGRLTPIFQQQEGHFLVTAFLTTVSGEVSPQTGETGVVAWVDRETLCSGPFGEFNAAMFAAMDDAADKVREIGKRRNPSAQPSTRRRTPTRQHPVYLFCYGSNNTKQLQSRLSIPGGSRGSVQGAYAPGYQRVFRGMSRKWGGGTASLEKKRSATTYGLVVELLPQDLEKLDRYEGVHSGVYKRQTITVYTQDGEELEAIAYVSLKKQFNPPTEEYLDAVAETISMFWEGSRGPVTADDIPIR